MSTPWIEARPVFSPATLGNLVLHLDAADLATGDITTWPDRTSNAYDFTAFAGRPPENKATVLNGQPGVEFRWKTSQAVYDGEGMANGAAGLASLFSTVSNPWTIHYVGTLDSLTADANFNSYYPTVITRNAANNLWGPFIYYGWQDNNTQNNDYYLVYQRTTPPQAPGSWEQYGASFADAMMSGVHLWTHRWNGTVMEVYLDGVLLTSNLNEYHLRLSNWPCAAVEFGNLYDGVQSDSPMATFGAVYIQAEAVSADQLAGLTSYLHERY